MSYVNVGCFDADGNRIKTKKRLKELLVADPKSVRFDKTALFDGAGTVTVAELSPGTTLSVVGPDPFRKRSWYASVQVVNGKVTVK